MKKRAQPKRSVHRPGHVTPAGRSVFHDLFPKAEAEELEIRSVLLSGLGRWLSAAGMTQTEAAKVLGVTQARISDIRRGKINQFSLDLLVRLAARAGLRPTLKLVA
jgi:predicted XRE-type DNA-binding protein